MERRYFVLDVFTEHKLTGNPLAVVLSSEGLSDEDMQRIAAEFNLSETVFVTEPADKANSAALRIFTPQRELLFAGHPTVGTAVLLSRLPEWSEAAQLNLEEKAGLVVTHINKTDNVTSARFTVPGIPDAAIPVANPDISARATGLSPEETGFDGFVSSFVSLTGANWLMIPVNSADAIAKAKVDLNYWHQSHEGREVSGVFLYTNECVADDADFHARMYAPDMGIIEDPATGSAVASFAGCLTAFANPADGMKWWKIEQGYEMGRASQIGLGTEFSGGVLSKVEIEGSAVVLMEGILHF